MERQLAAARGLGPMGERPPDEDGGGVGPGGIPTAGSKVIGAHRKCAYMIQKSLSLYDLAGSLDSRSSLLVHRRHASARYSRPLQPCCCLMPNKSLCMHDRLF